MIRQSLDGLARFSPTFRRMMMRTWYESLVVIDRKKQVSFMNYGYAPLNPDELKVQLTGEEEANRYAIQLYHKVATAVDLSGKDVVEVGSGRGGGAAYISRHLKPRSMLGVDISRNAVDFCNRTYAYHGLSYSHGDAEHLPLADRSADAVINIESSHCYGSMSRFLAEVKRVLRPGGHFLMADHRDPEKVPMLREQFAAGGFEAVRETDVTDNVVRALELDNERKKQLIHGACPRWLRKEAGEFAALVGTRTYESFRSRASLYLAFVMRSIG